MDTLEALQRVDDDHFAVIEAWNSKVYDSSLYHVVPKIQEEKSDLPVEEIQNKDISKVSREELLALPWLKWDEERICNGLIIIPSNQLHESGYLTMTYCGVVKYKPKS